MQRKFVLIVQYESGEVSMITSHPDLVLALQEFKEELVKNSWQDKSCALPIIKSAKIVPVLYESIYKEKEWVKKLHLEKVQEKNY